jgi:hypothetical protein
MKGVDMLSSELNRKILKLAPRHTVSDIAPHSFETLKSAATSGLVVYSGGSDDTIYGDPRVNWAFRAWHDQLHLDLNAPFTLEGERLVGLEQARLIGGDRLGLIMVAEVVGQIEYLEANGGFPVNQAEFLRNYLKGVK